MRQIQFFYKEHFTVARINISTNSIEYNVAIKLYNIKTELVLMEEK